MAYANGLFPTSATTALATAPGQRLEATAARQWDALARSVQNTYGWLPVLTDSYRPLSVQRRIFFERYDNTYRSGQTRKFYEGRYWYKKPGVAAAATPGYSNHGWAKAVDVSGLGGFGGTRFKQLASLAPRFGFTNTEGRSVNEAWHWVFTGAYQVSSPIGGAGSIATPDLPNAPAPIDPIEEDDEMLILARTAKDPTVWLSNGVTRYRIPNLDTLKNVQWLIDNGYQKAKSSAVQTIDDVWALGYPVDIVADQTLAAIAGVDEQVWATPVSRDGKKVSALQELADAKTLAASVRGENAGLKAAVDALAAGKALTAEQISEAARKGAEAALKDGVKVTIDIPKEN